MTLKTKKFRGMDILRVIEYVNRDKLSREKNEPNGVTRSKKLNNCKSIQFECEVDF